jgi:phosphoribosylamine--glycine ligase
VFGPTQAAARIETSKAWAKRLMLDAGVPTARATRHTDAAGAKRAAATLGAPVVVKASGLAAGKGVIVAQTLAEAEAAVDDMLVANRFGEAGAEVLVEEFMEGEELSLFFVTDGTRAVPLPAAQDHKRLLAGDRGPNTGGMGAYAPVDLTAYATAHRVVTPEALAAMDGRLRPRGVSSAVEHDVLGRIVEPTLAAMRAAGCPFTGLLYAGLMLTADGPRVVEFNCRFGDPETQVVLPLMDAMHTPLGVLVEAVALGGDPGSGAAVAEAAHARSAVTTVLAAAGYPERVRLGDAITLPQTLPPGVTLFHAGTALDASGALVTAGGRVLAVTAVADTFEEAQRLSRSTAQQVQFDGKQVRDDIGWREVARRAGTP